VLAAISTAAGTAEGTAAEVGGPALSLLLVRSMSRGGSNNRSTSTGRPAGRALHLRAACRPEGQVSLWSFYLLRSELRSARRSASAC